jgi:hypothetical protein
MKKEIMIGRLRESYSAATANELTLQSISSGRARIMSSSPELFMYYSTFPDAGTIGLISTDRNYLFEPVIEYLQHSGWALIRSHEHVGISGREKNPSYQSWVHEGGYMLNFVSTFHKSNRRDKIMSYRDLVSDTSFSPPTKNDGPLIIEGFELVYSMKRYGKEDHNDFTQKFLNFLTAHSFKADRTSKIGIISQDGSDFYVKNFSLEGKVPPFANVDEHYGEGFNNFHNQMIDRIKSESKGLILFHGDPGTGKTQYIRMLLDQLTRANKSILYVPPSFSSQLTEPRMIEFISDWVLDEDQDCILLIEDAEPLLEVRNGADGRSTGISNLLNMTDGILNDMLGLMVIATFNTSISKIDSALLRAGRLIARKEFNKLSKHQAQKLATALKVELPPIEYPATLAEFYTRKEEETILIHEVKEENNKIGFK